MGKGMSTRIYPLSGGDGDEKKVWYLLSLGWGWGCGWIFFFIEMYMR